MLVKASSDKGIVIRLNRLMLALIKQDTTHASGERTVTEAIAPLEGFNFNENAKPSATVAVPYTSTIDRVA